MFGSDCRGCYSAHDYAMAQARWHKTPLPRSKYWEANERPLDNVRKHHYRIVQGEGEAHYDVMLYSTVMARFHKPTPEGVRVQYNYYDSVTSHNFMWQVLNLSGRDGYGVLRLRTTEHKDVMVPIGPGSRFNAAFGATLHFVDNDTIDVARSDHGVVTVPKYTPEFKEWRAAMRDGLKPLTDLFEFCAEEARQDWGAAPTRLYYHPGSLQGLGRPSPEIERLRTWCMARRGVTAQDILADAHAIDLARDAYTAHVRRSLNVRDYRELPTPPTDVLARAATRSLLKQFELLWNVYPTVQKQLPKFVERLPGNFRR